MIFASLCNLDNLVDFKLNVMLGTGLLNKSFKEAIFWTFILLNLFSSLEILFDNVIIKDEPSTRASLFNSSMSEKIKSSKTLDKSVSGLIEEYYEEFNAEQIAPFTARKYGKSTEDVLAEWKAINLEAITRGNRVHLFGEQYQFNRKLKPSCPQEEAIVKFWEDMPSHIVSVAAELRMYHFTKLFAGTADILLYDTKTKTFIIADYKTNKDIYKNFKEKTMLPPFTHLLDSPLNHYQLQLSFYQLLLEQIGVKVSRRVIVWLRLDGTYEMVDTEDMTPILKSLLN